MLQIGEPLSRKPPPITHHHQAKMAGRLACLLLCLGAFGERGLQGIVGAQVPWMQQSNRPHPWPRLPLDPSSAASWSAALAAQAQDVAVSSWFPDNPANEFFPGQDVTCVIGVRNGAAHPINVTFATANLASPFNAEKNLYNFTVGVSGGVG